MRSVVFCLATVDVDEHQGARPQELPDRDGVILIDVTADRQIDLFENLIETLAFDHLDVVVHEVLDENIDELIGTFTCEAGDSHAVDGDPETGGMVEGHVDGRHPVVEQAAESTSRTSQEKEPGEKT
jgi:hypothetical protein